MVFPPSYLKKNYFLLLILFVSFFSCKIATSSHLDAINGTTDLSAWEPNQGLVNLKGDWEFCWDELIPPGSKESIWKEKCQGYFPVPSFWKFYKIKGENLPIFGKATYRLKLRLPRDSKINYGLFWTEIMSAFEIFINSRSVVKIGRTGDSFQTMKPDLKPGVAYLGNLPEEAEIVIWVSNFNHENHGFWEPLYFGKWESIARQHTEFVMKDIASCSAIIIIGLYHLIIYLSRLRSKEYLLFGLFCIVMGIRQLNFETHTFYYLFPNFEFDSYIRFLFGVIYLIGILMITLYDLLFPEDIPKLLTNGLRIIFTSFLFTLFLPVSVFTHFAAYLFGFLAFVLILYIPFFIRALLRKREGAALMLFAYSITAITLLNDLLFNFGIIHTGFISHFGVLLFIFIQAIILSKKITKTLQEKENLVERLGEILEEKNKTHTELMNLKEYQKYELELQVRLRTEEYEIAKQIAETANNAKSQFLATMSHEIRTPMNGILGIAELLKMTSLTKDQGQYLKMLQDSGQSLLTILNDILDYSKLEAGKIELLETDFSWKILLELVEGIFKYQAEKKNVKFEVTFDPDFIYLAHGDENRIKQVLFNIISNAVKFTETGEIKIRISSEKENTGNWIQYKVSVADTGIGIPEDKMNSLFQRFTQLDSSISRKYGGTGLGLAISKKITDAMGGELEAKRNDPIGTSFEFRIRLLPNQVSRVLRSEDSVDLSELPSNTNILIAEDDPTNLFLFSKFLKKLNVRHDLARDGREAVDKAKTNAFHLIFMDINMPNLDGIGASEEILKDISINPKPIIVAVSADAFQEDREKCFKAGMSSFLPKPFQKRDIEQALYEWLIERKTGS
ncbi:ATP-binding protein [Leptospira ilyithenensis]|uniref:histidine kinase n=1 Tax=Leptospira ilyithenensis TaxID=2484901 RepID=A0A4R9LUJ5_9LEPT|nr:ATP-binding protein [Leptospira ilyithenensis]TGN11870.1 response regulator [Leptospira ilyithenensis]